MAGRKSKRQIAYAREIEELLSEQHILLLAYSEKVKQTLRTASERLIGRLAVMPEGVWKSMHYDKLSRELKEILDSWRADYLKLTQGAVNKSGAMGQEFVINPLRHNIQLEHAPSVFAPASIDVYTRASVNLSNTMIAGAQGEVESQIMSEIMIAMAGEESTPVLIDKISKIIQGQLHGETYGFKTLNNRSWAIFRTETMKIHNIAGQLQMRRANEIFPESQKTWHHGLMTGAGQRPRMDHVALDGSTIPFNEPWQDANAFLMYPHDPNAPAESIVNCGCTHSLAMPDEIFLQDRTMVLT